MNVMIIYTLLVCCTLGVLVLANTYIDKNTNIIFFSIIFVIVALLPITYYEIKYSKLNYLETGRQVCTALGYMLKSVIPYLTFISLIRGKGLKGVLWGMPIYINAILCILSIHIPVIFYFTEANQFIRGSLNFLPFAIGMLYVVLIFIYSIKIFSNQRVGEIFICMWLAFQTVFTLFVEIKYREPYLFVSVVPIIVVFYYIYLYTLNFKLDALTGVYSRACYEIELKKMKKCNSCGVLVIDINGLKTINDKEGHQKGDEVIKKVAIALQENTPITMKLYRAGGDEFIGLWKNASKKKMDHIIEQLRIAVDKTRYSVSMGSDIYIFCNNDNEDTIEDSIRRADRRMYDEKRLQHS